MANLVKKVQNTIFQNNLLSRGNKILLAVSGGPDSSFLLDVFSKLQKKYNLGLAIAHVNYGLRGKDSQKDEQFVRDLARKYGHKIFVLNVRKQKNNSENLLRNIRYDFFERVRNENNFDLVAIAHNRDDQVETYLIRLIRGSGLQGLSSMRYKNNAIIRPILNITRAEIEKYLKEKKLGWRIDKTNLESKYLRNKIRNKLIPYLERNFNPKIRETIFHSIGAIAEDYDFISEVSKEIYLKNKELSVKKISTLHPSMQKRVWRLAIENEKSDLKNIDAAHILEITKMAKSTKSKAQNVNFQGLKITRNGDRMKIEKLKK